MVPWRSRRDLAVVERDPTRHRHGHLATVQARGGIRGVPLVTGQRYVLFLVPEGDRVWSYGCGGSSGGARADTVAAILDSLSR